MVFPSTIHTGQMKQNSELEMMDFGGSKYKVHEADQVIQILTFPEAAILVLALRLIWS